MKLGPYELFEVVYEGDATQVFRAHDTDEGVDVAVKLMRPVRCEDDTARLRFQTEAQLLSRFDHPNVLGVHDVVMDDRPYLVTEWAAHGACDGQEELSIALDTVDAVLAALEVVHADEVVHRGVSPDHVLRAADGSVKLTGFRTARPPDGSMLTQQGEKLGSWLFAAPEQRIDASDVTVKADQFSVGALLYFLLTGKILDLAIMPDRKVGKRLGKQAWLAPVVTRAAAYSPGQRYDSVTELRTELRERLHAPSRLV